MSEKLEIDCPIHGKKSTGVVCGHLINNTGNPLGFIENSDLPEDLQGWCYACEWFFEQENEMNENFLAFNQMQVICIDCYHGIKQHHQLVTE